MILISGLLLEILTQFRSMSHFYTLWWRQKSRAFLTFLGGTEMNIEMNQSNSHVTSKVYLQQLTGKRNFLKFSKLCNFHLNRHKNLIFRRQFNCQTCAWILIRYYLQLTYLVNVSQIKNKCFVTLLCCVIPFEKTEGLLRNHVFGGIVLRKKRSKQI